MTKDDLEKFLRAVYNHAQPDKGYDGAGELTIPEALLEIRQFITEYTAEKVLEARANDPNVCEFGHEVYGHKTSNGWCCACEADIAWLQHEIDRGVQAELAQLKEKK